jgi:hypothetical protein
VKLCLEHLGVIVWLWFETQGVAPHRARRYYPHCSDNTENVGVSERPKGDAHFGEQAGAGHPHDLKGVNQILLIVVPRSLLHRFFLTKRHRDGKRFVVRADEKLTAFLELETAIRGKFDQGFVCDRVGGFIVNANRRNFADKSACKAYNCLAGVGYGHSFSI